ncbi:MAG: 8-amino-7-oxononanoate synthase [Proteobacteria bacterium]|nr:8-amino-7-oxononanoate synthase [Pseudomonadota bacterium]NBS79106.1 8-amino-7-oxononanoate synthase [bacterium]
MRSDSFLAEIETRHTHRRRDHRQRNLGNPLAQVSFSDNDYLGLSNHPLVIESAQRSIGKYGTSARAARLLAGPCEEHNELESALASWKGAERALLFASGYLTPIGVIPSLVGPSDTILLERQAHACLFDGAKLSGARLRLFSRQDMPGLETVLRSTRKLHPKGKILVVAESLHSMDGDFAPLDEIIRLKQEAGAWLLLDEAHAGGICGPQGAGRAAHLGLVGSVDVQMGTLGKALGSSGGFVASQGSVIEHWINEARTFLFGTALSHAAVRAALTALNIIRSAEGETLRNTLQKNIELFRSSYPSSPSGPIHPIDQGTNSSALFASQRLHQQGLTVPAIRTPTVPPGSARLRVSLSARHTPPEIERLTHALHDLPPRD